MRRYVQHRVNRAADLRSLSRDRGVEIDLRSDVSRAGALHLAHDPWQRGEAFTDWLAAYKACGLEGPLILNTKEDGLEDAVLEQLTKHQVSNFFFLDTTLPTLVRATSSGEKGPFAVRYSRHEPLEQALAFAGRCQWVWVDCFEGRPVDAALVRVLKADFRICLVSPELHPGAPKDLEPFAALASLADAICSKTPEAWRARFPE